MGQRPQQQLILHDSTAIPFPSQKGGGDWRKANSPMIGYNLWMRLRLRSERFSTETCILTVDERRGYIYDFYDDDVTSATTYGKQLLLINNSVINYELYEY